MNQITPPGAPPLTLEQYVSLSAILTGIAEDQLNPPLNDPTLILSFMAQAESESTQSYAALASYYIAHASDPPASIGAAILADNASADGMAFIANAISLMWYLGAWYQPSDLFTFKGNPKPFVPYVVVSQDAYTESWVWRVGQTHPMGYSTWRFGYWNTPPLPLNDFIGA